MIKSPIRLSCQIYLLLVLLAVATLSSLLYSPVALILLLVVLFITFRPLQPRLNMVVTMAAIFILPLLLEPLTQYLIYTALFFPMMGQLIAVIATLPVIHLLDYNLRQNAQNMTIVHNIKSRHTTTTLNTLFVSTFSILLVSLVINNSALLFTTIALVLYLLVILIRVLLAIPRLPIDISTIRKRVIAGTAADISLHAINKASIRLHSLIGPVDSWVRITPHQFTLNGAKTELNLNITPPLAGPSYPQLQASVIDPRGVIQVNQLLQPVELHVIPRARYAEWLAMRYLEQAGARGAVASTLPPKAKLPLRKRGVEYFDSRNYQPGDLLKDIDWKHTLKLNQLIVKEYIEVGGQVAIIAVNLSVTDAEEADKLAFNLITTALTLAQESIPTALAIYNHQKVILTTPVSDSRETLKHTLLVVKDITSVEFAQRFLQPPDISKLRRNITLLKRVTSKPAQRLLTMLDFEYQAIEEAAKGHPATIALLRSTKQVSPPAMIILVSQLNHDVEALLLTSKQLFKRGFTTIPVAAA